MHDISIIQQRDGHNCGLFALDNVHRISQRLLGDRNANIYAIQNSLRSYNDHELQVLRRDIASELENDIIRQGTLINIGMLPQVIEDDQSSFAASLDCMIWAGVASILQTKHKRSTSEVHNKIIINKQFLDDCKRDLKPHMLGFELLKLIHWKQLVVDVESCDSFSKLIHSFYAALYSKIHGVDIEVLRIKIQKAFASQDISQLSRVLDNIKDLNILEIISKETFIIHSVEALNIAWTRLLIEKGANVNAQDTKGNTALYYAIKKNDKAVIKLLIEEGANLSPIHLAIKNNNTDICKLLIEKGANVNAQDTKGNTALYYAIKKNDKAVIKLLIEEGANLNIHNYDGDSPIHLAIKNNNTDICKLLIEKGANVNAQDAKGNTPVIIATAIKNKELVNDLIDVNAKNDDGDSAIPTIVGVGVGSGVIGGVIGGVSSGVIGGGIMGAGGAAYAKAIGSYSRVDNSDSEILENLIEHGANLNVVDSFGNTPLHHAAANNDVEMVELCINNNANIDARNHLGETPLHIATNNIRYRGGRTTRDIKTDVINSNIDTKTKKIISILVQHNANLSIQNNHDDTALHLAVKKHAIEVVELLLNAVMDGILLYIENNNGDTIVKLALISGDYKMISCFINFRDYSGSSILHLAVKNNAKEIIGLLIKNKVDLNIVDKDGYTAIHLAVASSNEELVEYLIGYKVNINIQDMRGNTPIHLSAGIRNIKIFEMLLENNANLNLKNKDNKTAIQLAKEYGMDVEQFQLPTPMPYKDYDIEDLTIRSKDLENTYYHKHRHHHGEIFHRGDHHHKDIADHHRGRIVDKLPKIVGDNYDNNMLDFKDDIGKSNTDSRLHPIIMHNAIDAKQTISQDATKLIGDKTSTIRDSVNNKLVVDWQGNLLLGYLLFGKKCSSAKCEITQEVVNEPKDSDYAHRLAYSSYAPVIEDKELVGEG
ncbi:ankyrin repeat domain-containing protein [Rickettsia endosymbiont of Urophora cardui]|uniref:ankyrin repeat domain-containing protein n=1 Tax=Rickettsia endosymbiont of Urophora cardui TaxID=3066265 RepID=UPI00313C304D